MPSELLGISSDADMDLEEDIPRWDAMAKNCRICGKKEVYGRYVNCYNCRVVKKAKEDEKKLRKKTQFEKALAKLMAEDSGDENGVRGAAAGSDGVGGGRVGERRALLGGGGANIPNKDKTSATTTTKQVKVKGKSKVPVALRDLEGKDKQLAMLMMRRYVKGQARNRSITASAQAATDPKLGREYQTASHLYGGIRFKCSASRKIQFRGFHTIIMSPEIDNQRRLDMVIADVRKIARVAFDQSNPISNQKRADDSMNGATFKCACSTFDQAFQPKGAFEALQWQRQRRMAETKGERGECNGTIKITVEEDDESHPLGIVGQRISVAIDHPKGDGRVV